MDGRILFDMQKEIQKGHALESYKLDNVSSHFMKAKVKIIPYFDDELNKEYHPRINKKYIIRLSTKNTGYLKSGDYIGLNIHPNLFQIRYVNQLVGNILRLEAMFVH